MNKDSEQILTVRIMTVMAQQERASGASQHMDYTVYMSLRGTTGKQQFFIFPEFQQNHKNCEDEDDDVRDALTDNSSVTIIINETCKATVHVTCPHITDNTTQTRHVYTRKIHHHPQHHHRHHRLIENRRMFVL